MREVPSARRGAPRVRRALIPGLLAALLCTEVSCSQETLPERQPVVYEDFGTEVYRILAWELEMSPYAPEAKVAVLAENREEVIWA
ncbi:MAG: hypothetical protein RBU30_25750, partial [Polyangia bacterium]|nr:hypothetical protein [Polyangia bacterium]